MQRLNAVVATASRALRRRSETELERLPSVTRDQLPATCSPIDLTAGLIIWRGTDGSVEIARPLKADERKALQARADELGRALEPFDRERPGDEDRVAGPALDMYGSFPSMRQEGMDAMARVDSLIASLVRHQLPTWAIEEGCRSIQDKGYERTDGKRTWTERQWAPSDSEVARVAAEIVRVRDVARDNALAVLGAKVGR